MLSRQDLSAGTLLVEGRLVEASNATLFGKVTDGMGVSYPVVYKPIAGERALWDFADGNLASREYAAFLVSEYGGFHCVPSTVFRDGPFGLGVVQEWIEIEQDLDVIAIGQQESLPIRNLALFDVVINNSDRKFGHILPTSNSRILGCDHGLTFHKDFKLRTVLWQFAGRELNQRELEQLGELGLWIQDQGEALLKGLITMEEREALGKRVEALISDGFPYPSQGWPAVPWPPV